MTEPAGMGYQTPPHYVPTHTPSQDNQEKKVTYMNFMIWDFIRTLFPQCPSGIFSFRETGRRPEACVLSFYRDCMDFDLTARAQAGIFTGHYLRKSPLPSCEETSCEEKGLFSVDSTHDDSHAIQQATEDIFSVMAKQMAFPGMLPQDTKALVLVGTSFSENFERIKVNEPFIDQTLRLRRTPPACNNEKNAINANTLKMIFHNICSNVMLPSAGNETLRETVGYIWLKIFSMLEKPYTVKNFAKTMVSYLVKVREQLQNETPHVQSIANQIREICDIWEGAFRIGSFWQLPETTTT